MTRPVAFFSWTLKIYTNTKLAIKSLKDNKYNYK